MNWQKEAINELRNYQKRKQSLENITERIHYLKEKRQSLGSQSFGTTPVQGGGNRMEDSLINNIVERERLALTYNAISGLVQLTNKGLMSLSERERIVLEKFYIDRIPNYLFWLTEKLNVEQSQVYRIKDSALYNFTVGMYGLIDY